MTQINLIPWREQARQNRKILFGIMLGASVLLAVFFIILLHLYYDNRITAQQNRNTYLEKELNNEATILTDLKKKKEEQIKLIGDLNFITSLRENSYKAVRLLDALARIVPEGISFNKIIRTGNTIIILGRAKSNMQITLLMENITKANIFRQPELTEITGKESSLGEERFFQLKIEQQK